MQESGVPNVSGEIIYDRRIGMGIENDNRYPTGCFNEYKKILWGFDGGGAHSYIRYTKYNCNYVSNQYTNNLNEVRVKSIISIGFIKLY